MDLLWLTAYEPSALNEIPLTSSTSSDSIASSPISIGSAGISVISVISSDSFSAEPIK